MFVLIVELKTSNEHAAALELLLKELVVYSSSESGIVHYTAQRSSSDNTEYVLVEFYKDRAAWMNHLQDEYVSERIKKFEHVLAAQPVIKFCEGIAQTF